MRIQEAGAHIYYQYIRQIQSKPSHVPCTVLYLKVVSSKNYGEPKSLGTGLGPWLW
jgi:hypothetical protein